MNIDIVDLLLDCDNFGPDAFEQHQLRHRDGRPFTAAEHDLAAQATMVELRALRDYYAKATAHHTAQQQLMAEMADLVKPYFERLGGGANLGQVRDAMTPDEQARLDHIVDRITAG